MEDIYYYSEKESFILTNKNKTLHIHFKHYNDLKEASYCRFHVTQMEEGEYLNLFKEIKDGIFFQYFAVNITCQKYTVLPFTCKAGLHIPISKVFQSIS